MDTKPPQFVDGPHGRLAYRQFHARSKNRPTLVWLGGFRSDMLGSKAEFIMSWAEQNDCNALRFDYSGHGESDGNFRDGTISQWALDARTIIEARTQGPLFLIGSSMGGWISMIVASQSAERIAGLVLIAPAPDFTEVLMWPSFDETTRDRLMKDGFIETPSDYSDEPDIDYPRPHRGWAQ